ncbi:MAG: hypothetical protein LBH19_10940 [Dysgonamonadaceae bacterium]|jgi:hypothetical protein|nr:hypothetical protein [Dysgonamonadaceae bacterium]
MKKLFFLLLTVVLCVTKGYAQIQPNIYASGLSAGTPANGSVAISYTLNADATALSVNFVNGDYVAATVAITEASLLTKGAHTATISLETVPQGTFTWTVTATANANAVPQKISNDAVQFLFYGPRGVAVDNDFESPFFGRVYVSEGSPGLVTSGSPSPTRTTTKGIYILNATLEDVTSQSATAYGGGVAWGALEKISVGKNGKVFIADNGTNTSSHVWMMDPANPSVNFIPVFSGSNNGAVAYALNQGDNLYTFDWGTGGNINQYDISTLPCTASPMVIYNDAANGNLQQNGTSVIIPDGRGGWWISQHRADNGTANIPCLIHYNTVTNTVDYNSGTTILGSYQSGMAYFNTGTEELLALGTTRGTIKIWSVTYNGSGTPTLTDKWTVSTGTNANARAIDFDKAMNLYAIDNNTERLRVFALPKAENTFTTPAPAASTITVAAVEVNPVVTKTDYSWNTGNASRDAAVYDGKVYVIDNSGKIHVIDGVTGDENTGALITNTNLQCFTLTSDGAGKLYVPSINTGGSAAWNISTVDLLNANTVATLPYAGGSSAGNNIRADYIEAYRVDAATTYIAGISTGAATPHLRVWSTDGSAVSTPSVSVDGLFAASGSDVTWIDAAHLIMTGQSQIPKYVTIDPVAGTATAVNIGSTTTASGGSTYFVLGGTPYLVLPDGGFGAVKIFDITDKTAPVQIGSTTAAIGAITNGAIHVAIESIVNGNVATLYVWSPNNGLAIHKMVAHPVPQPPVTGPEKTFTVTAPGGTEHVYIAGTFTDKSWDITNPYELTPTANPNEFSGTFPCEDGVEYLYFCEKGDGDYVEGVVGAPGQPAEALATNRTVATGDETTDVIPYWYNVKKIKWEVTFDSGVTVPGKLSVRVWPNAGTTSADVVLTRSGSKYTGSYGGNSGDKFRTNTAYKYFVPTSTETWENHADREATAPGMEDVITGFVAGNAISGTYYIPKSGEQRGWASLYAAVDEINMLGISGDVTLLITSDLTEPKNIGLLNATDYSITIRPDADANRTIRFSQANDNAGPSGAFLMGIGSGITWAEMAPAKNITIDGFAEGGSTRRLKIITPSGGITGQSPIVILNDADNITIKNSTITVEGNRTYAVYVRSSTNGGSYMPKNIVIENNEITNKVLGSAQGIATYTDGSPAPATGIIIKDNIITATTRCLFLSYLNGVDITGNEFHILQTLQGSTLSEAIYAYLGNSGNWNIQNNKFIELKTANPTAGNYGVKAIYSDGTSNNTVVWNINNNYFAGFTKTSNSGVTNLQGIHINTSATVNILHNTFYLNHPGYVPATVAPASETAAAYSAVNIGSGAITIENNLFVSAYADGLNYFIRGNATANNNVFAIAGDNAQAQASTGTITGTNVAIEGVIFANAATGNLDIAGASDGDGNLAVPFLTAIPKDIHGTDRNTPLAYAGAFEGDVFTTGLPTKTFTVVAPEGTEHVYVAGTFTVKNWRLDKPYELAPTGNPNEFSGTFPCEDGVEYLYFCEKSDWDYVEGIVDADNRVVARAPYRTIATGDETFDEISYWFHLNKVYFEVSFAEGLTVPAQLLAHVIDHQNTEFDVIFTKQDNNLFTGVLGGYKGDKYQSSTSYNYFFPFTALTVREVHAARYITAPKIIDVITGVDSETAIIGTYYIPNSEGQKGWNTLQRAFEDINTIGISGDVTLLITADIVSPVNVGLINNTEHSIAIRPDADEDRTITFNQTSFDNVGPWGSLCLGIGNSIQWKDVAPAKHIVIDGYAEGGSTRRLKITSTIMHYAGNFPILILDASTDITIQNCIIEHIGKTTNSSTYGIYLRTNPNAAGYSGTKKMPTDVTIVNNEIINTSGIASQGIGIYADAAPAAPASGIVIQDNTIRARTRGIFLNDVDGIEITGNTFQINQTSGGLLSSAIFGSNRIAGDIFINKNKFVEMKTANTGAGNYGIRGIEANGGGTWYIDNNYFTGFGKATATGSAMLQAIRAASACVIRHNTFYLNQTPVVPEGNTNVNPGDAVAAYCAINIAAETPEIKNNLFVSAEDRFPNFFIRGNAPEASENNVFSLPANAVKAKIASGTIPSGLQTVNSIEFADASAGDLDLAGTSIADRNLAVTPLEEVPTDIYGTPRGAKLAYAGAFEGLALTDDDDDTRIDAVDAGDIRIVREGNQLTITASSGKPIQAVKLYDLQGRTIASKQGVSVNTCQIPVPGKGAYIVEIWVDGVRKVQKTVIR